MFDIASGELLLVALVALLVIGPKDLPRVLRIVGNWVGKARGVAAQFRSGFDEMVRQSELDELEKKWAEENARIMAEHPTPAPEVPAVPETPARTYDSEPPPAMTPLADPPPVKPKRVRKKTAAKSAASK